MPMYRKKPVVIEAVQWDGSTRCGAEIVIWINDGRTIVDRDAEMLLIWTLEGLMEARPHDWIIKGVKGEFYPCKPDIFAATYEAVDADVSQAV